MQCCKGPLPMNCRKLTATLRPLIGVVETHRFTNAHALRPALHRERVRRSRSGRETHELQKHTLESTGEGEQRNNHQRLRQTMSEPTPISSASRHIRNLPHSHRSATRPATELDRESNAERVLTRSRTQAQPAFLVPLPTAFVANVPFPRWLPALRKCSLMRPTHPSTADLQRVPSTSHLRRLCAHQPREPKKTYHTTTRDLGLSLHCAGSMVARNRLQA